MVSMHVSENRGRSNNDVERKRVRICGPESFWKLSLRARADWDRVSDLLRHKWWVDWRTACYSKMDYRDVEYVPCKKNNNHVRRYGSLIPGKLDEHLKHPKILLDTLDQLNCSCERTARIVIQSNNWGGAHCVLQNCDHTNRVILCSFCETMEKWSFPKALIFLWKGPVGHIPRGEQKNGGQGTKSQTFCLLSSDLGHSCLGMESLSWQGIVPAESQWHGVGKKSNLKWGRSTSYWRFFQVKIKFYFLTNCLLRDNLKNRKLKHYKFICHLLCFKYQKEAFVSLSWYYKTCNIIYFNLLLLNLFI